MNRRPIVQACLAAFFSATAFAAQAEEALNIPRALHAPRLEDFVAGVPADAGLEVSGFRQNTPGDGEPVSLDTKAYLSYDDKNIYVVFKCKDDPKLVRAHITPRDKIFGDEGVQIFLDTFHDKQRAYVFSVNPLGVQMDSKLTESLGYDFNYDTQWTSDGRVTDDGYVVTMQIPFKSLRFEKGQQQSWGLAVNRIIPRSNEFSYWPYITKRKEGFIPQFAEVKISDSISPGRNIQVIPHASYRNTRALEFDALNNPVIKHEQRAEVGVDAKFVLHDSLAIDLTVNPDFSEVESDEPQVIVNKRYEVLFPEKRPFFLENSDFFGTPVNLFFSRRIDDPKYGARLTGRLGRWALGGLLIDDEQAGQFLTGADAGKTGQIAVARVQRDFGVQSNFGGLVTSRTVGDHQNQVYSLDMRYKLNDNWVLAGQAARSHSEENSNTGFNGSMFFVEATRGGRNFTYDGQYIDISPNFQTNLGFVPRTDIKQLYQTATYLWQFPDAPWLVNAGPSLTAVKTWNQNGDVQDWSIDTAYTINGSAYTTFKGQWNESYEFFDNIGFRKNGYTLSASTEWLSWLTASASISNADAINFIPAAGLNPFLGNARQFNLSFTFSPLAQLRVNQSFIWDQLRTTSNIAGFEKGSNVFRNTLSRTKFTYRFSRFISAHVIFDYNTLQSEPGLIALDRSKRLTSDILFSYTPTPGTALYVGYVDRQENLRLFGNPSVLQTTDDLNLHTGKQFYVKWSYLFKY